MLRPLPLQLTTRPSPPALRLRLLDISGTSQLSDHAAAQLLCMSPQLRVLHAAGCPQLGPALLAALAGRLRQEDDKGLAQEGQGHASRRHERSRACAGTGNGCDPRQPSANGTSHAAAAAAAAERLRSVRLTSAAPGRTVAAGALQPGAAALAPPPACPLLEALDLSGCATQASALRRALRCLPRLRSLRLNGCSGVGGLLEPLVEAGGAAGGSQAARTGKMQSGLAALTRLEALDSDVEARHVQALLGRCTALRRLALSGGQLAADGFDRQQHGEQRQGDGSGAAAGASLVWLEVGWGTGGAFLLHLAQRHCPHLAALTVHVGAAVSDSHLESLAASCPHLGRLCLRGANVSDAGEAADAASLRSHLPCRLGPWQPGHDSF